MTREKGIIDLRSIIKESDTDMINKVIEIWESSESLHKQQLSIDGHEQDIRHCHEVEKNISKIIPDGLKGTKYSIVHLYLLSIASCLHDIGKVPDIAAQYPPDQRHGLVAQYEITKKYRQYGLEEEEARIVGNLIGAHDSDNIQQIPKEPFELFNTTIFLRPLASILKLADMLHSYYTRVPFGVPAAGDNEKTIFRRCIRPPYFLESGGIVLPAVISNVSDVEIIHNGIEMMETELRPFSYILKQEGLPHFFDKPNIDNTRLKIKAVEKEVTEKDFLGMDYFTEQDTNLFKGRDELRDTTLQKIFAYPICLLIGESGIGKTSFIRAGLFPLLNQLGWKTIYARPFGDPVYEILTKIRTQLHIDVSPNGSISEVFDARDQMDSPANLLITIDQFEDIKYIDVKKNIETLREFLEIVNSRWYHNINVIICYRGDAENNIGPYISRIMGNQPERIYIENLDFKGAEDALMAGFNRAHLLVDNDIIRKVLSDLEKSERGIYTPFLQMIGETLRDESITRKERVTLDMYEDLGNISSIIGKYLYRRFDELFENKDNAISICKTLIRASSNKYQRTKEDIIAESKISSTEFDSIIDALIDKRIVRRLDENSYEIIHDYLGELIDKNYISDEERLFKGAREILRSKSEVYLHTGSLLEAKEAIALYNFRDSLKMSQFEKQVVFDSWLINKAPCWYWFKDYDHQSLKKLLINSISGQKNHVRKRALSIYNKMVNEDDMNNVITMLDSDNMEIYNTGLQSFNEIVNNQDIEIIKEMLKDKKKIVRQAGLLAFEKYVNIDDQNYVRKMLDNNKADVRASAIRIIMKLKLKDDIEAIKKLLKDENHEVRYYAVKALGELAFDENKELIKSMFQDDDYEVSYGAAEVFGKNINREDYSYISKLFKSGNIEDLNNVLRIIIESKSHMFFNNVISHVTHEDEEVRTNAIEALIAIYTFNDYDVIKQLIDNNDEILAEELEYILKKFENCEDSTIITKMLLDNNHEIQLVGIKALKRISEWNLIEPLVDIMRTNVEEYYKPAEEMFIKFSKIHHKEYIYRLMKDDNWIVSCSAIQAYCKLSTRENFDVLFRLLSDEEEEENFEVVTDTLERLLSRDDLEMVKGRIFDEDVGIRYGALHIFGLLCTTVEREFIMTLFTDQDEYIRSEALNIFSKYVTNDDISIAKKMLKDNSHEVRINALNIISKVGKHDDYSKIVDSLSDRNQNVRQHAITIIGELSLVEYLGNVLEMLNDTSMVRNAAIKTIKDIGTSELIQKLIRYVISNNINDETIYELILYLDLKFYCPKVITCRLLEIS